MTRHEANRRAEWMRERLPNVPLYIVVSPEGRCDIVAQKDWNEPHPRNNLTPRRKEDGWVVLAQYPAGPAAGTDIQS